MRSKIAINLKKRYLKKNCQAKDFFITLSICLTNTITFVVGIITIFIVILSLLNIDELYPISSIRLSYDWQDPFITSISVVDFNKSCIEGFRGLLTPQEEADID